MTAAELREVLGIEGNLQFLANVLRLLRLAAELGALGLLAHEDFLEKLLGADDAEDELAGRGSLRLWIAGVGGGGGEVERVAGLKLKLGDFEEHRLTDFEFF